jgi:UrcA family protein
MKITAKSTSLLIAIAAGVGAAAASLPASAQGTVEELIVTGRLGAAPDNVKSLSRPVSYADLDLSTEAGRHVLHQRVSLTARWLCDKLGEGGAGDSLAPSCRDAAVKDAKERLGTLEAHFAPRGTTWVAGPAWATPYPADWVTKYPD